MNRIIEPGQFKLLIISLSKELLREPGVLFWGIGFPLLMALGLGIAFTQSKDVVRKVAVTETGTKLERFFNEKTKLREPAKDGAIESELKIHDDKLGNSTYIFRRTNWKEAIILIKRGEINLVLDEKNGTMEYNFDPVNPEAQLTYLNLSRVLNTHGIKKNLTYSNRSEITSDNSSVSESIQLLSLKGTRYIDFFVPGLVAMGIMMSSVWGLGYGLIEKRSKKLLRRMIATPMRKSHFLISLMLVRMVLSFIEALLLYLFSWKVFGVSIDGSIPALLLIFLAGNFAFGGVAILAASRTSNTEIGNGIINAVTTPMIVLSGIFFSYHNFPEKIVALINLLPLTILADSIRSIFIEGSGLSEITIPFFVLTAMGFVFFSIGLKYFKWH